ncbi:MAG: 30S ribosomal protein S8e [Candidatus Micrarchaeia archaeon]|jgi:small subunit ribosomal protein S8e
MVQYHRALKTKGTGSGGRLRASRDKIKKHVGGFFARTKLLKAEESKSAEKKELKEVRVSFKSKGGRRKVAAEHVLYANVTISPGKAKKAKILNVVQSPDNRHYARENVMTRGAIIDTEAGKAKITSRPGQSGVVNAILVK